MKEDFSGLYNVRNANEKDKNFILATFLRGIYYGDTFFSSIPKTLFMERYKSVANALLNDYNTEIRIACLPDDEDVIIGYSISSKDGSTVNWVFVKAAWRQKGIAKNLIPNNPRYVVPQHITKLGKSLLSKLNNVQLNPFF